MRDVAEDARSGSARAALNLALETFREIESRLTTTADRAQLMALRHWCEREHAWRQAIFATRNTNDAIADVAAAIVDLEDRGQPDAAARFLNAYLSRTNDYVGLPVLRFYIVRHALVQAKTALARGARTDYRRYLTLAARAATSAGAGIVITRRPVGSDTTRITQALVEALAAIRVRTDADERERAYSSMALRTRSVVDAGYVAIVEGAFAQRPDRDRFRSLAIELNVSFVIVDFTLTGDAGPPMADPLSSDERAVAASGASDDLVRVVRTRLHRGR
jgi:hypothetical protein